ncbi:hypothetical protein DEJ55_11105 [Bacillus pumilus]|uniref:hypothetical protein n=1 Tax=Bacillus pumilus TaxID=1408 RepID=UPI000DCA56A8|nr:hypothetical protein [Bacillus pumilus]RAU04223.1 hypothetical protein DEJ55_11105 [Bacillus pumilus]
MKTVKCIIFFLGAALINFVVGIPHDTKNLFITHTIFLAPYLVDYFPLLKTKSFLLKILIYPIWIAGITIMILNILGIFGVITLVSSRLVFAQEYVAVIPFDVPFYTYIRVAVIVYAFVFIATLTLRYDLEYDKRVMERKLKKKKPQSAKNGVALERG